MTEASSAQTPLLQIENLSVAFPTEQGPAYAVRGLNLVLKQNEILGVVGESGCGKSLTSMAILGLIPRPGRLESGHIYFKGQDLTQLNPEAYRKIRGAQIALIPQDPLTSLNPVYTIANQMNEVIMLHQGLNEADATKRSIELLDMVKVPNAKDRIDDYPHQFSGGMRQRVIIAMALSCNPQLLIADEPTTALDVTVQAQILELMNQLQRDLGMAIILITHDLGVVAEMCQRVAVMYAGRLVEEASVIDLFATPYHPYTKGLLNSIPIRQKTRLEPIEGQPPPLTQMPPGCSFEPRCPERLADGTCTTAFPQVTDMGQQHTVCCYLHQKQAVAT